MFYCKGKNEELNQIVKILEEYSLASGQKVNYQKSRVYFGKQLSIERKIVIKHKLGIMQERGDEV